MLRSPLSGVVDSSLTLLSLQGRRTGREVNLPVQYAVDTDALWVWPGQAETKTWWRNLAAEAPVQLRLRGRTVPGTGVALRGVDHPAEVERGLEVYAARFPSTARRAGLGSEAPGFAEAAKTETMVRLIVPDADLGSARKATLVQGNGPVALIRRHNLGAFFLLAYLFSWSYWLPIAIFGQHLSHFPGLLGPMLAAFTVGYVSEGETGVRDLWVRMFRWRVPFRWYLAALIPAAAGVVGVAFLGVAGNGWPSLAQLSTMPGLPAVGLLAVLAMVLVINGYGEEVGWRGFAWVRLRERHSLPGAAALLGILWAGWHLPVFWLDTGMRDLDWFVIPGWVIGLMAGAVVLGWLYEHARSSLLIVAIFHTALNMASATLATEGLPAAIASATVIVWSILILRGEHPKGDPSGTGRVANIDGTAGKEKLNELPVRKEGVEP